MAPRPIPGSSDHDSTDDNRAPLTAIAYMKAASGKTDEFREALTSLVEPTNQEEGCLNYDLHESIEEPGLFFYENRESAEHLEAHRSAPHLADVIDKMDNLLDEDGLKVNLLRRIHRLVLSGAGRPASCHS